MVGSTTALISSSDAVFNSDSQGLAVALFSISKVFMHQTIGNSVANCSNHP